MSVQTAIGRDYPRWSYPYYQQPSTTWVNPITPEVEAMKELAAAMRDLAEAIRGTKP